MDKVQYPARLVVSRYGEKLNPPAKVWADEVVLQNDQDLAAALRFYRGLDCGGVPYTLTMANLADVDRVIAERWAEINELRGFGKRPAAPASVVASETHQAEPAALEAAYQAARVSFDGQPAMLERLDRALAIVKAGDVRDLGGGQYQVGDYHVNGACTCPDHGRRGVSWCKHRLAVALVKKAAALEKERAGCAVNTPALPTPDRRDGAVAPSKGTKTQRQYTTAAAAAQA